ncbi:MAG: DEAD/DEAH box helicase [Micrococcales bacterium]|nr:DEAD/DEAH box helicase [Micrococcales bacterium]
MYNKIIIKRLDEVYVKINCERSMAAELSEYFTFYVPGYKFMPAFRNKLWDGKIRLFNTQNHTLYAGLIDYVKKFASEREYKCEVSDNLELETEFSIKEATDFINKLNIPFQVRDYQLNSFIRCVRKNRALLVSPTASGKSLIIYLLTRYYNAKTLIIVPTISLVTQLSKDMEDYGYDSDKYIYQIMAGVDKNPDKQIVISTWQSIYKLKDDWFDQFDVVIGDEAHQFKAKSLTTLLSKMKDCKYRFGLTGTLDGTQTHKLVLEGLFGKQFSVTTTKELMDTGRLASFKIKALLLKHSEENCKTAKNYKYQDEIEYLVSNYERNRFIRNLVISLKGNTLVLFQLVEKHGKVLYDLISQSVRDREVFFVHGGIDVNQREYIRQLTEKQNNAIIIASYGTFSTGINIRNLHNIVFASPSKSKIRTLQSIGRGLRLGENKESAVLYDIADDISYKAKKNFTLMHFTERMKIYGEEKFEYKIYTIELKE